MDYVDQDEAQDSPILCSGSSSHTPILIDNIIAATRTRPQGVFCST